MMKDSNVHKSMIRVASFSADSSGRKKNGNGFQHCRWISVQETVYVVSGLQRQTSPVVTVLHWSGRHLTLKDERSRRQTHSLQHAPLTPQAVPDSQPSYSVINADVIMPPSIQSLSLGERDAQAQSNCSYRHHDEIADWQQQQQQQQQQSQHAWTSLR